MRHTVNTRLLRLVAFETLLIMGAVAVAVVLRLPGAGWRGFVAGHGVGKTLVLSFVTQGCLYYADLYDLRIVSDHRELFIRLLQALGVACFILAGLYYVLPEMFIGRGVLTIAVMIIVVLVGGCRLLFDWLGKHLEPRERLLIVGTSAAAVTLARELYERHQELGVSLIGFVDPDPAKVGQSMINPGVIGTIEDIPAIVKAHRVDRVVVSLADARGKLPMDRLLEMKLSRGVSFDHLASVYEEYTGKIAIENLRPSWLIFSEGFKSSRLERALKRAIDVGCSAAGLVLLSPIIAIVALLVRLTSKGPALYHQARVGAGNRVFTVHKFRSMRVDAEAATGAVWAASNDTRLTPIGRFIRRTRLDELPQLWNVLKGDMSLVGPRPERPEFVSQLTEQIPFYGLRHAIRPGLTGWAQVRYTYGASVEDALQKLQYDLFYIKHATPAFDLFIMFSTIKTVILRRGAQ